MGKLKLITFDLDNTLWPVDEVIRRAEMACQQWLMQQHPDAAAHLTPAAMRGIRDDLLRARPDYLNNLTALRTDLLSEGFRRAGYSEADARQFGQDAFEVFHQARNQVNLFPGALSNGNADLRKAGLDGLFQFHHNAESIGRRKPAPDMFLAALGSADAKAHQSLHIGDHPREDIQAALEVGFDAIWANLLDLTWPDQLPRHPHQVTRLDDLADLIERLDS